MTMLALKIALARRLSPGAAALGRLSAPDVAAQRVLASQAAPARALVSFFTSTAIPGWSCDFARAENSGLLAAL